MAYIEHEVTPELLRPLVEQPEPSVDGEWYVLDLRTLINQGYGYVQFHFVTRSAQLEVVKLTNAALVIGDESD